MRSGYTRENTLSPANQLVSTSSEVEKTAASARCELPRLLLGGNPDDAPGEPELLEGEDHPAAGVNLNLAQSVKGRRREGVMVVVPGLAERDPGEPPDIARLVARDEASATPEVADRVDREGDVVEQEDPDGSAPDEPRQKAVPAADQSPTDNCRDEQRDEHQREEEPGDHAQPGVSQQI